MYKQLMFYFLVLVTLHFLHVSSKKFDVPVSVRCFICICHASSGCNIDKAFCRNDGCGAFRINEDYWIQAGRPTVNEVPDTNPEAFRLCANNPICMFFVIQRYMEKNQRDCNGDDEIDCEDFLRIHKLGAENCTQSLPKQYLARYEWCQDLVAE